VHGSVGQARRARQGAGKRWVNNTAQMRVAWAAQRMVEKPMGVRGGVSGPKGPV